MNQYPVVLTIAGSDSGGGAGIQADLKTFAFHGVHGTTVLTCLTAQNTVEVTQVVPMTPEFVLAQLAAVTEDFTVKAIKTGMLLQPDIIERVAQKLEGMDYPDLVVDPVMVSRAGKILIEQDAINSLRDRLVPLATLVTPNRYEAQILSGITIDTLEDMKQAALRIKDLGPGAVLIKGGAMTGASKGVDCWYDGKSTQLLGVQAVDTRNTHGTGCTLSAAITANLALGKGLFNSVVAAKEYVTTALTQSLSLGKGPGPVGHFFPILGSRIGDTWQ